MYRLEKNMCFHPYFGVLVLVFFFFNFKTFIYACNGACGLIVDAAWLHRGSWK